jgi:hypothetical protein
MATKTTSTENVETSAGANNFSAEVQPSVVSEKPGIYPLKSWQQYVLDCIHGKIRDDKRNWVMKLLEDLSFGTKYDHGTKFDYETKRRVAMFLKDNSDKGMPNDKLILRDGLALYSKLTRLATLCSY